MDNQAAPEEKTLVNLVSKIPKDKQEEIAKEICEQYQIDLKSRSEWEQKRDDWYKLWACIRKPKDNPWPGASNVRLPILATACNQFHGRAYQSVFNPPGMVKALPVGSNDIKHGKNVEDFLNWQILYEMEEYEEIFDKLLQQLPINGTHFKKTYYSKDLERPVSEQIGALDLVLPYKTKTMETSRRTVHRVWLYYDELQDRNDQGLYENFDKIPDGGGETEDDSSLSETADEATGIEKPLEEDKPHLILECHKNYDLGNGRQPYVFTVEFDSQILLRVASRKVEGKIINYFTDYHFIPNPNGFYSFGFGHFLENFVEMAETAFNQIFDAGRLSNQPFGFYGRRAGIKKRTIKLHPGIMTEVEDAKNIYFPSMQRVDQVLFQLIGLIQGYVEQFTSTSDYLMGRESKGTKTPTAHGTMAIIEQGLVTFAVITKRVFRSLRKELRLIMALNQIYLPDSKEYRIMGSTDRIAFQDIKKKEFDGVKDVIPIGDPSYASKASRREEAGIKYQTMMQNPLVVGNPELGMKPNIKAMHEITSEWLDTFDTKNKDKILPDLPEEMLSPEMENALFMQGDYSEPKPGENHVEHDQKHLAFMQGPYFKLMEDEYKKLVIKHRKETMKVAMLEEQQTQALGGRPQGQPMQSRPQARPPMRPQGQAPQMGQQ